jgi:serine/threonine-protein kinase HipA
MVALSCAIENGDAHLKNFAVLYENAQSPVVLAPAYDLVSTTVYHVRDVLALELDAIDAYRRAIVHDPGMADAHFYLSALHDRLGEAQAAFRHLLAYRRLQQAHGTTAL